MAIVIKAFTEDLAPAVQAFNRRLTAGGLRPEFRFPESSVPGWLPKLNGQRIYQDYYVAVNSESVHGGFILKSQDFCLKGEVRAVGHYRLPVSEGTVNRAYAGVGVNMLRAALKTQPLLFSLGMGGFDQPLPQMLRAAGWTLWPVPFFFRVNHPVRFLRQIAPLRKSLGLRLLSDLAAFTGTGWLGIKTVHFIRTRPAESGASVEQVDHFGPWADALWERCRGRYLMIGSRDSATLNALYPDGKNFICLRITRGPDLLGWAVVLDTQMRNNKYFGNLRVGTIADGLAVPEHAPAVVQAATNILRDREVDLIVSNQSHQTWRNAVNSAGFLEARSNFIFAASRQLSELLSPLETAQNQIFLNRGDGDGPVNL